MRKEVLRPGMFSVQAAADFRRLEFDMKNEIVISNEVQVDFVFVGDSITHNWELNAYFGRTPCVLLNRGIGGDRVEYLKRRVLADAIQLKPRYTVIKIGINNTWELDEDAAVSHRVDEVEQFICREWEKIAALFVQHGQQLIIGSLLPTNIAKSASNRVRNELIVRVNQHLKELAAAHGFLYLDYHTALVAADGLTLRDGLADDGLHPHSQGYNLMAQVFNAILETHGIPLTRLSG